MLPAEITPELARTLTETGVLWAGRLIGVLTLLIGAWVLGFYVRRAIGKVLEKTQIDETLGRFLGNVLRWVIFVMGVIACLGLFGFNITSVAALVGAAGLTIGLAMQGSLSNLAAGIMLMLLRPFKIGDVVSIAGQVGRVDDLDLFNTKIDTPDNRRLIVPNGQVFGSTIENITHHAWRRAEVVLLLAYSYDQTVIRSALTRAGEGLADRQPGTAVEVQMQTLGVNALEWAVRVWVPAKDFTLYRDRLIERVKSSLDQSGISISHR